MSRLQHVRLFGSFSTLNVRSIDHICVCVSDVDASIRWYERVLGLKHEYKDHPSFGTDPAFMQAGSARIALLPLADGQVPISNHNGAHFAFNVDEEEWLQIREKLPTLLLEHRVSSAHNVVVDEEDYGLQLSLFFEDPDKNILEVTTWKE
jgi:catechol 2,3-dioxygenase-like lactoylglutathione lyase family enzyme